MKKQSAKAGFVYLISSPDGHYKIGCSKDVPTRSKALGIQLPYPVELIHTIKASDMYWAEGHLHNTYSDKRTNGEWFRLEDADVEWIKSLTELEPEGTIG